MLFEILMIALGIYLIVSVIKMKSTGNIPAGLINRKINLDRSHDKEGYINYMYPRGLIFGVVLMGSAAVLFASRFTPISPYIVLAVEILYIAGIIYYAVVSVRAQNRFLF